MRIYIVILIVGFALPALAQEVVTPKLPVGTAVIPKVDHDHAHDHDHEPTKPEEKTQTPQERLLFLLSGYHYFPTSDDLGKVGSSEEVAQWLRDLAQDVSERPTMRMRAMDALMYFSDETTLAYVEHVALQPPTAPPEQLRTEQLMQHHAIMTLAKIKKEGSVSALVSLLGHPDIQIQMTAISALGKHGSEAGRAALLEAAKKESSPVVQREYRKYVKF